MKRCIVPVWGLFWTLLFVNFAQAGGFGAQSTIPEFVMSKDVSRFCQLSVRLSRIEPFQARQRLFDFMDAANQFTHGWKHVFGVVGVDYLQQDRLHAITLCSKSSVTSNFIFDFFERWSGKHCTAGCRAERPKITNEKSVTYGIPYAKYQFRSQIYMFLNYRPKNLLKRCVISADFDPKKYWRDAASRTASALDATKNWYRFPIMDIVQINSRIFILFSGQCDQKERLYTIVLEAAKRRGYVVDPAAEANFDPDISDYVFSETGKK